jgi:hypothetical protein
LILSIQNPNIFYHGELIMSRYEDLGSGYQRFSFTTNSNNPGDHDDVRACDIALFNSQEFLLIGNDGGIGLVQNSLSNNQISSVYGNLNTSLIHGFDIHEGTKRIIYAFQDHSMIYQNDDGSYSNRFLWEGSVANIYGPNEDVMLGENAYSRILNHPLNPFPYVGVYTSGGHYLGGTFVDYKSDPSKFYRGIRMANNNPGGVVRNISLGNTDIAYLAGSEKIGGIGICETNFNIVYAAENSYSDFRPKLYKSVDAGANWIDFQSSTVSYDGKNENLNIALAFKSISSIAVTNNPDVLFCGISNF